MWSSGGPLFLNLPIPPVSGATQGFVMPGPATAGPAQILLWNPPNSGGGTGGAQGAWEPSSFASLGVPSGSGTANNLTKWTGAGTVGNSSISENAGIVTMSGYGVGVIHSDPSGVISSAPVALANDVNGILPASNGGTGTNTYATGDILYANSASSLAQLPAGASGQVLGISGGVPAWVTNTTTVTVANTTNTPTAISVSADNYTVDASSNYIRLSNTSGGAIDITGINSAGVIDGRAITLVNTSANTIVIKNQDASSSASNQFDLPGGADILIAQKGAVTLIYDAALHFWELVSTN
jgi:hypothetical protein